MVSEGRVQCLQHGGTVLPPHTAVPSHPFLRALGDTLWHKTRGSACCVFLQKTGNVWWTRYHLCLLQISKAGIEVEKRSPQVSRPARWLSRLLFRVSLVLPEQTAADSMEHATGKGKSTDGVGEDSAGKGLAAQAWGPVSNPHHSRRSWIWQPLPISTWGGVMQKQEDARDHLPESSWMTGLLVSQSEEQLRKTLVLDLCPLTTQTHTCTHKHIHVHTYHHTHKHWRA